MIEPYLLGPIVASSYSMELHATSLEDVCNQDHGTYICLLTSIHQPTWDMFMGTFMTSSMLLSRLVSGGTYIHVFRVETQFYCLQ